MKPKYKPLYIQVMENLNQRILSGAYSQTEALPSETRLSKEYGVSISTIRQAISVLVANEVLVKKQGKGTYISPKKRILTFLTWLTETPKSREVLLELIGMIEEKYPSIEIEVIPTEYPKAKKELERMISAGKAPDIAHIVSHWTGSFAASEAFIDLENVIPKERLAQCSEAKNLRGGRFKRKLYSVSWGLCPISMIANLDVLKKFGIEELPEKLTFNEWEQICNIINKKSSGETYAYGMPYNDGEADFLRVYQFIQAFGGEFVNRDGEVVIHSAENVRALNWLKGFCGDGKVLFDSVINIRKLFVEDKVAFMHDGPWAKMWLSELVEGDFERKFKAILNPLYAESGQKDDAISRSWNYNHALAIPTQSDKVAQAAQVVDALTLDSEISGYYYRHSGHLPVSKNAKLDTVSDSQFYRVYEAQLAGADFINAENALFPKAMDFCVDAIHNIFKRGDLVSKELAEKQHYLEILYGYSK